MGLISAVRRELFYITELRRLLGALKSITPDSETLTPDLIEASVDAHAKRIAFLDEDNRAITYAEFDAYANRVANWAVAAGVEPGGTVALYMGNRWEYVAVWYGLTKVGVIAALLNNQVQGQALAHGVSISGAGHLIVEGALAGQYLTARAALDGKVQVWTTEGAQVDIDGARDLDAALAGASGARPDRSRRAHLRAKDPCLKMYTSGTTGLPKAAIVAHTRALYYLQVFGVAAKARPTDRMMMVLPMYHATGGLCGVGAGLSFGGAVIVRRKFSASRFWADAVETKATMFMYVGELCRFLVAADPVREEKKHKIRVAIGNGLRPDVWPRFAERSGIGRILEFYGATEGNVGLINLDSKPGAIGRVPPLLKKRFNIKLVRFDVEKEEPVRGADGRCIPCKPGEVGEAIGEIRADDARYRFDGYEDQEATKKKVLTDVFAQGDRYFRTGDLMKADAQGYYYFIDRIGDTFRWKSENVSTNEVAEVMGVHPHVIQANVYGVEVEGYPGRAGMAALIVADGFDLDALHAHVQRELAAYARPLFIRLHKETPEVHTTGTFKLKKADLVKEGWDPAAISDPVYFDDAEAGRYVPLTAEIRADIVSGKRRV